MYTCCHQRSDDVIKEDGIVCPTAADDRGNKIPLRGMYNVWLDNNTVDTPRWMTIKHESDVRQREKISTASYRRNNSISSSTHGGCHLKLWLSSLHSNAWHSFTPPLPYSMWSREIYSRQKKASSFMSIIYALWIFFSAILPHWLAAWILMSPGSPLQGYTTLLRLTWPIFLQTIHSLLASFKINVYTIPWDDFSISHTQCRQNKFPVVYITYSSVDIWVNK